MEKNVLRNMDSIVAEKHLKRAGEIGVAPQLLGWGKWKAVYLLVGVLYLAISFGYGWNWLNPGLPMGDLGGTVAGLARWRHLFHTGQLLATWNDAWFCGHSRALFNLNGGMELAYAPFLLLGDELVAVKVGALTYFGLSGLTAFILMRHLLRNRPIAFLMGAAYMLHPIHLSVAVATSHANFPPFYFLQPLLVWRAFRLLEDTNRRNVAWLALVAALTGWADFERLAVLTPWLAVMLLGILSWRMINKWRTERIIEKTYTRTIKAMVCAGCLTIALLMIFLLPAILEKPSHALFSEQTRTSSVNFFSIQNPLYYVDRAGGFLSEMYKYLPPEQSHDAGGFYVGVVLLSLAFLGLIAWPRGVPGREILVFSMIAGALALAAAQGPFSGYDSLCAILDRMVFYEKARQGSAAQLLRFCFVVSAVVLAFILIAVRQWKNNEKKVSGWVLILAAIVGCILFVKPFAWAFRYFPPYKDMRNPGWFATAMPSLALVISAGFGLQILLVRFVRKRLRYVLFVGVVAAMVWDVWPYRSSFQNVLAQDGIQDLKEISHVIDEKKRNGRILSRESYNPHADMIYAYGKRPAGFYWLNWMAPAHISEYVLKDIYSKLHRPDTIDEALFLAGWANVRYLVYDLTEGPPPPQSDQLVLLYRGRYYSLYENKDCKPYMNLLPADAAERPDEVNLKSELNVGYVHCVDRSSSNVIIGDVEVTKPAVLMVSESWFPGWEARVDGAKTELRRVHKAFMGIVLKPGRHRVEFRYPTRWYYYVGAMISFVGLLICLICLLPTWLTFASARNYVMAKSGGKS